MSMVSTKKFLFLLADDQDRNYYVEAGIVKKSSMPAWLKYNPDGAKDITLQWATNQKYFSTIRQFSNAIKFVKDGQAIIADRAINGSGTEEYLYLIILRANPSKGLNYYELEYKSRLDFSKFNGDPRTGISMNTLQDDVFAMVTANENAVYPIQCNATNPVAIKILFDGTLLQDKLNYEIIDVPKYQSNTAVIFSAPVSFINNEGDNSGVIDNSQEYAEVLTDLDTYMNYPTQANYLLSSVDPITVTVKGTFSFIPRSVNSSTYVISGFFMKSSQPINLLLLPKSQVAFDNGSPGAGLPGWAFTSLVNDRLYSFPINTTISLAAGEKLFFFIRAFGHIGDPGYTQGVLSSLSFFFASKQQPSIAYGVRGIDVLKSLVSQATNGRYTADSKFLSTNNRKVVLSGSSLRSFPDAVIQTSFSDFFQSFTVPYNLGVTIRNGVLWVEPIEDIYRNDTELINLGEISEVSLTMATEHIYTSAQVGYTKQTYNKRNGRYEYNCIHNYKFPIQTVLNKLNLVSPYRTDSFGMEFIRTGYPNLNSTDDKGDNDVFAVMVSDSVGQTDGEVSTATSFTVETLILAPPIIKTPYSNTTVYNAYPTVTGIAQPFKIITVYADGVSDGTTTSDVNGFWSYQLVNPLRTLSITFNGVHLIEANAQTDPTNISGFSNVLTLIINTTFQSPFLITTPGNNDTLYNNLPVISGIAPASKTVSIKLDGALYILVVTNSSGLWRYQVTSPIADGVHVISASAPGLADAPPVTMTINKNVSSPLITSIVYGDIIYSNLPLVKGVAIPGTVVTLYLDGGGGLVVGGIAGPMGTCTADANGDWSFQVTQVYDVNNFLTPFIPDGLHIISTTPTPIDVSAAISGYRLMRGSNKGPVMDYDAIRLDDAYIPVGPDPSSLPPTLGQFLHPETLYNIEETSPLRCLRAHDNILRPFLEQQAGQNIIFNGAEVNANLITKKNGITYNEGAGFSVNEIGAGLFHTWYLNFTSKVPMTFNDILQSINNYGYITTYFKGISIYVLPIGSMEMKLTTNQAQKFKLLISTKTPLSSLLQLFGTGLSLSIGKNMLHVSQRNSLHFVEYDYTPPAGFHLSDIYQDWEENRYPKYIAKLDYVQPFMKSDPLPVQIITNGVSVCQLKMVSVTSGLVVDVFAFAPVAGPVQLPNILQQVSVPLSAYPDDLYWFAFFADGAIVGISQKIDLREDWPDTLAFDTAGSEDELDFYYSTGITPRVRAQARFDPWDVDSEVDLYEDEQGDYTSTRAIPLQSRILQLGTDDSLIPEWMSLKMNLFLLTTNLYIEGTHYCRNKNSKMAKEDIGQGIVAFLYKIELALAENQTGVTFSTPGDTGVHTTAWSLDARAWGQNAGVINVTTTDT